MNFKYTLRAAFSLLSVLILMLFAGNSIAQEKQKYPSLLWKISGNGLTKDSYLFGTMHAKEEALFNFSDAFNKAFKSSETFAMEITLDNMMFLNIFSMMMADESYDIRNYLNDEEYNKIDKWLKSEFGFKLQFFERIKPIFIYVMTSKASLGTGNRQYLDEHLYNLAKEQNKEVIGLETIEEQVNALESITVEEQFKMILQSIDKQKKDNKEFKKLLKAYTKQNLDGMLVLLKKSALSDAAYKKMIDDRNINMADRMIPLMKNQSVFTAVGAGHLPGEDGIIELLRTKGYTVEPLK
jgi:uncharacterized protein YbaP (TraB family)